MQRKISFMGIVIFLFVLAGCTQGPPSPLSSLPTILIDHIEETEETKVFVQGIENTLYGNITIQLNNETVTENFTYGLHITTNLHKFILNITVWYELKEYDYTGNFTLLEEDNEITLEIVDARHDDPIERSAPYTIIMERKK
jgi:hypothetical protein